MTAPTVTFADNLAYSASEISPAELPTEATLTCERSENIVESTPSPHANLPNKANIRKIRNRKLRQYYKDQFKLIENIAEDTETHVNSTDEPPANGSVESAPTSGSKKMSEDAVLRMDGILAKVSFGANVCLFAIKIAASVLTGSMSVVASAVDSAVDLVSGFVIWLSTRKIRNRNIYKYPRGRTRLEPLAIIIVSVVMGVASIQVIINAIQKIIGGNPKPEVGPVSLAIMCVTILVKFCLMIVCYKYKSPNTNTLAQDHRNDCISNTFAITFGYLGTLWGYIDPIGAILVGIYICVSWFLMGSTHTGIISGKTASREFICRVLHVCVNHHPDIHYIDTMKVYHYGTKFLVEVDVVMDGTKQLQDVHDIAETLQRKIEFLPYVERAFVHIDYDYLHKPESEHKVV